MNKRLLKVVIALLVTVLISAGSINIYRTLNLTPESPNGSYNFTESTLDSLTISTDEETFVLYRSGEQFDSGSIRNLNHGNYFLDGKKADYVFEIRAAKTYQLLKVSPTTSSVEQLKQTSNIPISWIIHGILPKHIYTSKHLGISKFRDVIL